jgi:uncharacterized membrane protein (UPF0127 family)
MSVNKIVAIFGIILVIFIGIVLFQFGSKDKKNSFSGEALFTTARVTINGQTFNVATAKSPAEQQEGLADRDAITVNQGMLFLYNNPGYYSFWMKGMRFPLDIIFIQNNKVIFVVENAQTLQPNNDSPPLYQSLEPSDMVMEINAGLAKRYNIKKGDSVKIQL